MSAKPAKSTEPQVKSNTVAEVKPSLTIKRRIKADPAAVFAAWTDAEKIKHWWGPDGMTAFLAEIEPRVGGRFHLVMKGTDGEVNDANGVFKEFVPNEKFVMSWYWITTPERVSQLSITVKADGNETILTLLHEQFADEAARDGHNRGWTQALDKLVAYFA
tara:strand:- start:2787 stop:3269 length:483 start_codon:yes stop_codon:yes gene_type:complete